MVNNCGYARHHVVRVQHVPVVAGRVAPQLERLAAGGYARGQVLAAPGVVRFAIVSRSGHTLEGAPPQGICMTEIVLIAHIPAHPLGRLVQRRRDGQRIEAVLDTIGVDMLKQGLLLIGEERRLSGDPRRRRGQQQQKKAACHKKSDRQVKMTSRATERGCHNALTGCGIIPIALGPRNRVRRDRGGELVVQAGTPRPLLSITIDECPCPTVTLPPP